MKKWQDWIIPLGVVGLLTAIFFSIFPINNRADDTITLPDNYYQLPVESSGSIVCTEPKSKSLLSGFIDLYIYPSRQSPKSIILVASNAGLKESDLNKPIKSDEDAQKLVELLNLLKPYSLFHIHYLEDKRISLDVYTRKAGSWTDNLEFWKSQFEKEWQFVETWTYQNDEQAQAAANLSLRKVYGMDCRLAVQ
ncbi:MAG TPA: hypothetical protein VJ046_03420 [Candidatus Paceibacterota bacterium]|nr:hypothetical protein [Candidatus Paceibacterota bacterium]